MRYYILSGNRNILLREYLRSVSLRLSRIPTDLTERVHAGDLEHGAGVDVLEAGGPHTRGHQAVEQGLPAQGLHDPRHLVRVPEIGVSQNREYALKENRSKNSLIHMSANFSPVFRTKTTSSSRQQIYSYWVGRHLFGKIAFWRSVILGLNKLAILQLN